jgi:hypothetical protein
MLSETNKIPKLSVFLFALGCVFLFNSNLNITGAITGQMSDMSTNSIIGLFLVFASGTVYLKGKYDQDEMQKNGELFVKHHFKAYRIHLENTKDREILSVPEYKRDDYAKNKLYSLIHQSKGLPSSKKVKNEAAELLEHGRIPTKYKELKTIAERMGYILTEGSEHTKVKRDKALVTELPRHQDIDRRTAMRIVKKFNEYALEI